MSYVPEDEVEPPHLRTLRRAVLILIVVLILGILTIAATIVIRLGFPGDTGARLTLEQIHLPAGQEIRATGEGPGRLHVVLRAPDGIETLHVFDAATGERISVTPIARD